MDFVLWLQEYNNGLFDIIAESLHFMGRSTFFLIVLSLIYWSIDRKLGLQMLIALITSLAVNTVAKEIFQLPRPHTVNPEEVRALFEENTSYGFPSGHVMSTIMVWGTAALYLRKRWITVSVVFLTLIMGWARVYGGVHYPGDVIGGIIIGSVTLYLLWILFEPITAKLQQTPIIGQAAIVVILGIVLFVPTQHTEYGEVLAGMIFGIGFGIIIEHHYVGFSSDGTPQKQSLRYFIGLIIIAVLYVGGSKLLGDLLGLAIVGITAVAIYPYLATKTGLMEIITSPE